MHLRNNDRRPLSFRAWQPPLVYARTPSGAHQRLHPQSIWRDPELTLTRSYCFDPQDWIAICPTVGLIEVDLGGAVVRLAQGEWASVTAVSEVRLRASEGIRAGVLISATTTRRELMAGCHVRSLEELDALSLIGADAAAPDSATMIEQIQERLQFETVAAVRRLPGAKAYAEAIYQRLNRSKNAVSRDLGGSVEDMARRAAFSRGHFNRCFRSCFALSPWQHIVATRMRKAMALLGSRQCPSVARVAAASGYLDRSAFTRAFTQYVGISPTEYGKRALLPSTSTTDHGKFQTATI